MFLSSARLLIQCDTPAYFHRRQGTHTKIKKKRICGLPKRTSGNLSRHNNVSMHRLPHTHTQTHIHWRHLCTKTYARHTHVCEIEGSDTTKKFNFANRDGAAAEFELWMALQMMNFDVNKTETLASKELFGWSLVGFYVLFNFHRRKSPSQPSGIRCHSHETVINFIFDFSMFIFDCNAKSKSYKTIAVYCPCAQSQYIQWHVLRMLMLKFKANLSTN